MDAINEFLFNTWYPFWIGGALIVVLLAVFIFLRMRKTDD